MSPNVALHADRPGKTRGVHKVAMANGKCSPLYVLHVAKIHRYLLSPEKGARYTVASVTLKPEAKSKFCRLDTREGGTVSAALYLCLAH